MCHSMGKSMQHMETWILAEPFYLRLWLISIVSEACLLYRVWDCVFEIDARCLSLVTSSQACHRTDPCTVFGVFQKELLQKTGLLLTFSNSSCGAVARPIRVSVQFIKIIQCRSWSDICMLDYYNAVYVALSVNRAWKIYHWSRMLQCSSSGRQITSVLSY